MAETVGRVEIEVGANTAAFEQAIAKVKAAAAGVGGGGARILPFDTSKVAVAAKELERSGGQIKEVFRDVASSIAVLQGPLGPLAGRINFLGSLFSRVGIAVGGFSVATAGAALAAKQAVDAFADEEKQLLTLDAVLKATGGSSGQTSRSLAELADSISKTTLATDDAVRSAEGLMLTFRSISGNEFPRALRAAQDLAATGFGSIEGNARQLGRALEDPIRGLGSLRRSGVSFTQSQRDVIKHLVETGKAAEAQRVVLKAIEDQVGGAGAAQAAGVTGAYHQFSEALNDSTVAFGAWVSNTFNVPGILRAMTAGLKAVNSETVYLSDSVEELRKQQEEQNKNINTYAVAQEKQVAAMKEEVATTNALRGARERVAGSTQTGFGPTPGDAEEQTRATIAQASGIEGLERVTRSMTIATATAQQATEKATAALKAAREELNRYNDSVEGANKALQDRRDEMTRTTEQARVFEATLKNNIDPLSLEGIMIAANAKALFELERALKAAGDAGADLDKLKQRLQDINAAIIVTGAAMGSFGRSLDEIRRSTTAALAEQLKYDTALRDARQNPQAIAAATYDLALAREKAAGAAEPDAKIKARAEATAAEAAATFSLSEAKREELLSSTQARDLAVYNLSLVGKSIEQQNILRNAFTLRQQAEAEAARTGVAYDKEALAAQQRLAAEVEGANQRIREATAEQDLMYGRATMFMNEADRAGAAMARNLFGPTWQQNLDDSRVKMARLNVELQQAYTITRDFAGTLVNDLLEGKSAVDSLSDAFDGLKKKIIDMALDAVVQGMFGLLTGTGSGGITNIFSSLFAGGGGGGGGGGKAGGVYQHGGVVGSTPVPPIWSKKRLDYDEYPAILHVGERVIPAGGGEPAGLPKSGADMLRMFGGIPKFQSGFNAGAAAAGAYTAGDTGATGAWSQVSGGGGNVTLSNLLASQYPTAGPGGGTISLGSRGTGGGGVTLRPLTVQPRLRPISVAPVVAPIVPVLPPLVPLPRLRPALEHEPDEYTELLADIDKYPSDINPIPLLPATVLRGGRSVPVTTVHRDFGAGTDVLSGDHPSTNVRSLTTAAPGYWSPTATMRPTTLPTARPTTAPGYWSPTATMQPTTPSYGGAFPWATTPTPTPTPSYGGAFPWAATPPPTAPSYGGAFPWARTPGGLRVGPNPFSPGSLQPGLSAIPRGFGPTGDIYPPGAAPLRPPPTVAPLPFAPTPLTPFDVPAPITTALQPNPFALTLLPSEVRGWIRDPVTGEFLSPPSLVHPPRPPPNPRLLAPAIVPTPPDIAAIPPVFGPSRLGPGTANIPFLPYPPPATLPPGLPGSAATMAPMGVPSPPTGLNQILIPAGRAINRALEYFQGGGAYAPRPGEPGWQQGALRSSGAQMAMMMEAGPGGAGFDARFAGARPQPRLGDAEFNEAMTALLSPRTGLSRVGGAGLRIPTGDLGRMLMPRYPLYGQSYLGPPRSAAATSNPFGNRPEEQYEYQDLPYRFYDTEHYGRGNPHATTRPQMQSPGTIELYRQERLGRPFIRHTGGYVGSTPAPRRWVNPAIFTRAPRLHDGLDYDEYPAVLQRGERVVPRGGGGSRPVVININNNANASVEASADEDNSGGIRVDIMIDELVAAKMRDGGSRINRTLATMGARGQPVRR